MDACHFYSGENDGLMTGHLRSAAPRHPPPTPASPAPSVREGIIGGAIAPSSGTIGGLVFATNFQSLVKIIIIDFNS